MKASWFHYSMLFYNELLLLIFHNDLHFEAVNPVNSNPIYDQFTQAAVSLY